MPRGPEICTSNDIHQFLERALELRESIRAFKLWLQYSMSDPSEVEAAQRAMKQLEALGDVRELEELLKSYSSSP